MPSAETLSKLRDLQRLREKQQQLALGKALTSRSEAEQEHQAKRAQLEAAGQALDASVEQQTIGIGRLLLLAGQVSQLEREAIRTRETLQEANDTLGHARREWEIGRQRTRELDDRASAQIRRERRKDDDRRERNSISQHSLRPGVKP